MSNKNNKKRSRNKSKNLHARKMLKIDKIEWKEDQFYIRKLKHATISYLQRASASDKRKIYNETNTNWIDDELIDSFKRNEFNFPKWDT